MNLSCNCPGINPRRCKRTFHVDKTNWTRRQHAEMAFATAIRKYPELWDADSPKYNNERLVARSWKKMLLITQELFRDTDVKMTTIAEVEQFYDDMLETLLSLTEHVEQHFAGDEIGGLMYAVGKCGYFVEFAENLPRALNAHMEEILLMPGPRINTGTFEGHLFDGTKFNLDKMSIDKVRKFHRLAAFDREKWDIWVANRGKEKMTRREKRLFVIQQDAANQAYKIIMQYNVIERGIHMALQSLFL